MALVKSCSDGKRKEADANHKKGVRMYSNDLNSAYVYECERRKDEMRAAAQSNLVRELRGDGKNSSLLVARLCLLALLVAAFLNR